MFFVAASRRKTLTSPDSFTAPLIPTTVTFVSYLAHKGAVIQELNK